MELTIVDNWRDELKKFFRSIENISETALKAIKRGRTRNNLPFDDSFRDFILNRTSARIAHVYANLMFEDILEEEQILSNQDVNHVIDGSGHANIGQLFTPASNIPASIEQMPIILVQPNNQTVASNTTASTTFVQNGNDLPEQAIISIPPLDLLNRNLQQEVGAQSVRIEAVTNEPVIEPNSNNHIEKLRSMAKSLGIASTSIGTSGMKRVELFQPTTNLSQQNPETIDLTSDQEDATDSLDSNPNNVRQGQQNSRCQRVHEARAAENSKEVERFHRTQQSTNILPERAVKSITCDDNLVLKSTDAVTSNGNSQIQLNTNTQLNPQQMSKVGNSDYVTGDDEHQQENGSGPAEQQEVSNMQHPRMSSHPAAVERKTDSVSSNVENAVDQSQSTIQRRERDNFDSMNSGNKRKEGQKLARRMDKKKRHKCEYCHYSTENKSHLTRHIRTHTGARPYECEVCQKRFNQSQTLTSHMKTHRGAFLLQCSKCCRLFLDENLKKSHEGSCQVKQYECHLCKRDFSTKQHLEEHMQQHTGEMLRCSKCQKQFGVKRNLAVHMKSHGKLFRFQCSICRQGFSQKAQWKWHESRCKAKQYECYLCNKKFHQLKSNLLRHMRHKHTGEKPFGCSRCPKQFCEKAQLTRHVCNQPPL